MKSIIEFIKKEFLQFKRDPRMFALILIAPVVQLTFLGFAANLDVKLVRTIVFDQDKSVTSRDFVERFTSSGYFRIEEYVNSYDEITEEIDRGDVILALVIPTDFEKKIYNRRTASVQALFNGSDGNTAGIVAGYSQNIVSTYSQNIVLNFLNRSGQKLSSVPVILPEIRVWYNPELKTRNFLVPGIFGLLLSLVTLILTSLAIVKEKEIGTMEQLIVTPLKPYQIIIGKLVPFVILSFVAVLIILASMYFIFAIPVKGDLWFLFLSSFFYILSTLGLGLFVSTISKTQQQAMMLSIFAVMMPMIFLSGFAFPIENMPRSIQLISYIVPLRYFNDIIRGVILKGLGFSDLWFNTLLLFLMGVAILVFSSLRFKSRLE
ncbi:MAG: ABC transporter permease [Ignavibacteriaceae bacterium]|nr:ABC transporter permease [Ignavibacteriaceae bacterium]